MKRNVLPIPAIAVLCVLGTGACNDPGVKEQTRQAGEAIKAAGKETGEAATAAGNAAVAETKAAVEEAGGAIREAGQQAGKDISAAAEKVGDRAKEKVEEAGDTAKQKIADATLTATIKARLIANKDVKAVAINVDTVDGRVTLTGTAKTADQKDQAERIARSTEGVVSVDNRIVVTSK